MNFPEHLRPGEPASFPPVRRGGTLVRLALCVGVALAALGLAAQLLG